MPYRMSRVIETPPTRIRNKLHSCAASPRSDARALMILVSQRHLTHRQGRVPFRAQLLTHHIQHQADHVIVAHDSDHFNYSLSAKQLYGLSKRFGTYLFVAEQLAAEPNRHSVFLPQTGQRFVVLNYIDDGLIHALPQSLRGMRRPLELVVHLAPGNDDRQFSHPAPQNALLSKVFIQVVHLLCDSWAVK